MLTRNHNLGFVTRGLVVTSVLVFASALGVSASFAAFIAVSGSASGAAIWEFESRWILGAIVAVVVSGIGSVIAVALFSTTASTVRRRSTVFALGALPLPVAALVITAVIGQTPIMIALLCLTLLAFYFFALRELLTSSASRAESKLVTADGSA